MSSRYEISYHRHDLVFKKPAGTSRGILHSKPSFFIKAKNVDKGVTGIGECSYIPDLSPDYSEHLPVQIGKICDEFNKIGSIEYLQKLIKLPAAKFGLETAIQDAEMGGRKVLFDTPFANGRQGIPINGLIWMGSIDNMLQQLEEKIEAGYSCLKFKIGALDFDSELKMLYEVRSMVGNSIEIRLDANGAFLAQDAMYKLDKLAKFNIHSIEQPIKAGMINEMSRLCKASPIPVALDEELIGIYSDDHRRRLLETILPDYIILKPSLLGGLEAADEWVSLAGELGVGWWATSALESNIGLNAIAQWVATKHISMHQGLGTGALFTNNIPVPLTIKKGCLYYNISAIS